jgi:hypothetical protein
VFTERKRFSDVCTRQTHHLPMAAESVLAMLTSVSAHGDLDIFVCFIPSNPRRFLISMTRVAVSLQFVQHFSRRAQALGISVDRRD